MQRISSLLSTSPSLSILNKPPQKLGSLVMRNNSAPSSVVIM